jgi:hypothetical protein
MKNELKLLKEWAINYIKNRDILVRQIEKIEENKDGWDIAVTAKTGMKFYLIVPKIEDFDGLLKKIDTSNITIIVFNTKANLDAVINNWGKIKGYPHLSIMFVNPNSELDKKWLVFPHTHDRVTEKASFKRGLKALFQTVEQWKV